MIQIRSLYLNRKRRREPSKAFVIEEIRKVLDTFVGIAYGFTQPIEMRVSEMLTGVRGDLAIDIFGSDNSELENIAVQVKKFLRVPREAGMSIKRRMMGWSSSNLVLIRK